MLKLDIKGKLLDNGYKIGTRFVENDSKKHKRLCHNNYAIMDSYGDNWFLKLPYDNAEGKVLLCGLGLGILTNLLLTKDNITKIVVVEKEKSLIDYISQYINSDKVTYVWQNILEYEPDEEFDYCFIDIWNDENRKDKESNISVLTDNLSDYCKKIDFCQTLEEAKKYCEEE